MDGERQAAGLGWAASGEEGAEKRLLGRAMVTFTHGEGEEVAKGAAAWGLGCQGRAPLTHRAPPDPRCFLLPTCLSSAAGQGFSCCTWKASRRKGESLHIPSTSHRSLSCQAPGQRGWPGSA